MGVKRTSTDANPMSALPIELAEPLRQGSGARLPQRVV